MDYYSSIQFLLSVVCILLSSTVHYVSKIEAEDYESQDALLEITHNSSDVI